MLPPLGVGPNQYQLHGAPSLVHPGSGRQCCIKQTMLHLTHASGTPCCALRRSDWGPPVASAWAAIGMGNRYNPIQAALVTAARACSSKVLPLAAL